MDQWEKVLDFIQKFMIQLSEKDVILCASMNKLVYNVNDGAEGLDAVLRILASYQTTRR